MSAAKRGSHHRAPWGADPSEILTHRRWDVLKGTAIQNLELRAAHSAVYEKAKRSFDMEAANDLVEQLIRPDTVEEIVTIALSTSLPIVVVMPYPEYDPDDHQPTNQPLTNALPFAYASYIAAELGCDVTDEIQEVARPGRTKLNLWERFLWQPRFTGTVRRDHAYIIVDDVCTMAGTLAMLRSYIVENGGTVIAATTLASRTGKNCPFPIAPATRDVVSSLYTNSFSPLWELEVGHGIECLTENEGASLVSWAGDVQLTGDPLLQRLRTRLLQTATNAGNSNSEGRAGAQGPSG